MAASKFERKDTGFSNCYKLILNKNTTVYQYHVNIVCTKTSGRQESITVKDETNTKIYGYHEEAIAYSLLSSAHYKTQGFGVSGNHLHMVYDNRSILFTNKKIDDKFANIVLVRDDKDEYGTYASKALNCASVNITLTYTRNVNYDDYSTANEDRSPLQFLELLTAQPLIDSQEFIKSRGDFFKTSSNVRQLSPGLIMLKGMNKGVSLMKEEQNVKITVTVDVIYAPFFQKNDVLYLIGALVNKRNISLITPADLNTFLALYKNVKVVTRYNNKCYTLHQLSARSADDTTFGYQGEVITVRKYYEQRYGLRLQHPELQMLEKRGRMFTAYIPLEFLDVMSGQRVPMSKYESARVGQKSLGECVTNANLMNPDERYDMIRDAVDQIRKSDLFNQFGVQLDMNSNKVEIGIRKLPTTSGRQVHKSTGTFRIDKYAEPVTINRWVVLFGKGALQYAKRFVTSFQEAAQNKNVRINDAFLTTYFNSDSTDIKDWRNQFQAIEIDNPDIVFLIDSNRKTSHSLLKLCERQFSVLTQHISISALQKSKVPIDNILNKTNEKLNGLCYKITPEPCGSQYSLDSNRYLVFGYDVSHPKQHDLSRDDRLQASSRGLESLNPSVVGLSYNCAKNPCNFIGDYFYQEARKEQVDGSILESKVKAALLKWKENRSAPLPDTVFIFRDGISDGQFTMAIDQELPAFRAACKIFEYSPKFVFIVATKNHRKRFFNEYFQNISISSIIDEGISRPSIVDWHQQSANPVRGTAKPPNFILLKNEANCSEDVLQSFCAYLCYNHQIVSAPISLPIPVQVAHEMAKRGANNLEQWLRSNPMPRTDLGIVKTVVLNKELSYGSTGLSNQRFNA